MTRLAHHARVRAVGVASAKEATPMRSRLLVVATLMFGFVLSGSGVGLAISGLSGGGAPASQAQYAAPGATGSPTLAPTASPESGVRGDTDSNGGTDGEGTGGDGGGVAGDEDAGPGEDSVRPGGRDGTGSAGDGRTGTDGDAGAGTGSNQVSRQLGATADGGDELPFTGWAAIPIMLLGLAFLGGGLILRRRLV